MYELTVPARLDYLEQVQGFVSAHIKESFDESMINQIALAVEEIYVNIASYAYQSGDGEATIRCAIDAKTGVVLEFMDSGKPYNPLEREDPDVGLPTDKREIGGLGVFLVKTLMDKVEYRYENGKNILTIKKEA